MKRILGIILCVALLTGVAFTTQLWGGGSPAANPPVRAAGYIPAWIAAIQTNGFPWSEPVSIMLSSVILLGGTTMLRRRRASRRA